MDIGLFQLENLIHSNIRFNFLDLRQSFKPIPPELELVVSRGIKLGATRARDYLTHEKLSKDSPVILLSEDGAFARTTSLELESLGYKNIYVIVDGVEGLLSEL